MTRTTQPMDEAAAIFRERTRRIWRRRLSRQSVLKGSTILALGGSAALTQFLAACSGDGGGSGGDSQNGQAGAAGGSSGEWKDTTLTPPYAAGVADAEVPAGLQKYPYVYKYNFRRHNYAAPVAVGGHIVRGYGPFPDWDFLKSTGGPIGQAFMNGLMHHAIHEGLNLETIAQEPDLATNVEHNADYTVWTFQIPDNITFHNIPPVNGRAATAEDVVYSFEQYIKNSIWNTPLRGVDKVTAPDKTTVRFDLKEPSLTFRSTVELPYYNLLAREHVENQDLFKTRPIGTGAFMVTYSKYQDKLEAERHPEYFGRPDWMAEKYRSIKLPFADKMSFIYHASDADTKAAFIAGKIDEYNITFLDPPILDEVLKAAPNSQVVVNTTWAGTPTWIAWNYSNPMFQDVRVRRALSMAIDREGLIKNVLAGAGVPGGSPVPYDLQGRELPPDLSEYGPYYQFNPQEAKKLLTEAGYANGFEVELVVPAPASGVFFNIYTAVGQYWRDILKVNLKINAKDTLVHRADTLNRSYKEMIQPFSYIGYDVDTQAAPLLYPGAATSPGGADDPELKTLLDRIRTSTSPDDSLKLTQQMLQRTYDQVTYLWICWTQGCTLSQPWTTGINNSTYGFLSYFGGSNWRNVWIRPDAPDGRGGKLV
ncbi:MAG: ABC transporter substrate-binding protein [Dehalococcoidia bacterium]